MNESFLHTKAVEKEHPSGYFLTLGLVLIAYVVVGQFALLFGISAKGTEMSTVEGIDIRQLTEILGKNATLFYLIIPFVFALMTLLLCVKFIHKRTVLSVFTLRKQFNWKRFFTSFLLWGLVLVIFLCLTNFSTDKVFWNYNSKTFFSLLVISMLLIPLQTTCEEVIFRGYLMQTTSRWFPKGWMSVIFSGLLFGLVHGANPEVETLGYSILIYYIMTGIFLGAITLFDDGIELSMGYHAVNNIFSALIVTNDWQAFQTDALFKDYNVPSFGWESFMTIFLLQPILILFFAKFFNWKDMQQKLFKRYTSV